MHRGFLIKLLKVCVSVSLIVFLLYKVGAAKLLYTISSVNIYYILLAFFLVIGGIVISSYKWQILLSAQNMSISLPALVSFYFIGLFSNNFLPTSIGGDAVRIYIVSKQSKKAVESLTSVFMERATGLSALLFIAVVSLIGGHKLGIERNITFVIIALFVGFSLFLIVLLSERLFERFTKIFRVLRLNSLENKVKEIHNSVYIYKKHREILSKAMALSFVFQIISVMVIYIISLSLGLKTSLLCFFLFVPIISVLTMLPISLNGIGIREGAFVFFFTKVGISNVQALSMSLLTYAIILLASLIGAVIYAARR